jgi:oxygen-dependent protoporphyrinogen oxidase
MEKQICIVGGGISGLALLHHLNQRFSAHSGVRMLLLERQSHVGGTIQTDVRDGAIFEYGPDGFLGNQPAMLKLVHDLGLEGELLLASPQAKLRYVCVNNRLYAFPTHPFALLTWPLLSWTDKLRVFKEPWVHRGTDDQESVAAFVKRRLGKRCAEIFADVLASGIFAGDAGRLHLRSAFPRMYEWEQTYGSLFKALWKSRKQKKQRKGDASVSAKRGHLWSFRQGMGQLIGALHQRYAHQIRVGEGVTAIGRGGEGFVVQTRQLKYFADHLFLCTPAHQAAVLCQSLHPGLAQELKRIPYVPVAVAGLVYPRKAFVRPPQGFGYLVPSHEEKQILGVLFSSNIYPYRAPEDQIFFRIMMGGIRHPEILTQSRDDLLAMAQQEIEEVLGADDQPFRRFLTVWPQAIVQYHQDYPQIRDNIRRYLKDIPGLHLLANYLDGVAMNDCTANAQRSVEELVWS